MAAKKATSSTTTVPVGTPPIIISGGRAWPGTFGSNTGRTIWWENRDAADWTIRFSVSPFSSGSKSLSIVVRAGATSAAYTIHRSKAHRSLGYTIVGSSVTGLPPGEPQVTIGD